MADRLSRREFLRKAGSLLALGGIGALAVKLLGPGRLWQRSPAGETCVNEGVCRGCGAFAGCGLPAALSAKQRAPWARRGS